MMLLRKAYAATVARRTPKFYIPGIVARLALQVHAVDELEDAIRLARRPPEVLRKVHGAHRKPAASLSLLTLQARSAVTMRVREAERKATEVTESVARDVARSGHGTDASLGDTESLL